jgi:hypothetical protein
MVYSLFIFAWFSYTRYWEILCLLFCCHRQFFFYRNIIRYLLGKFLWNSSNTKPIVFTAWSFNMASMLALNKWNIGTRHDTCFGRIYALHVFKHVCASAEQIVQLIFFSDFIRTASQLFSSHRPQRWKWRRQSFAHGGRGMWVVYVNKGT